MKKTRFVFIALYLIFQAISAFALDKNLVQKKLVEGHPDYYREYDILHDIGIIESKKLGKLYIYFNEHHWGNYRATFRLIICDENKILGEYGILLMDKPWIKNNLLCFPYEEEIGNKIDFNNGIPKTVYVDGYLNNFTIYDINLNESKTVNLNVYHYAGNNLVKYVDPDGRANILSITPSDVELFLEETKQALSNIPTPAIVCVGIASGLIIANELSDGAVFEEIADGINFIADKTIEAGKWIGEKIAGLFSKGDKAKSKTKDKLEKMRKLEKGTSYDKVVSIFGEPDEDLGSGLLIVGYVFEDSKLVLHFFTGDTLQGLWEIKNNGEKIIYIPLKLDK